MKSTSKADPDWREGKRRAYVEEFQTLTNALGGTQFMISCTSEELVERAVELGATDRQLYSLLSLQESLKEIEASVDRQKCDPEYAAYVEREAAKFNQMYDRALRAKNSGLLFNLGRAIVKFFLAFRN